MDLTQLPQPASDFEFMHKHQILALSVSKLPVLRNNLQEVEKQVTAGLIGNAARQRDDYNNCVNWIKRLAAELTVATRPEAAKREGE
jgi:hypothetical protein